MKYFTKEWYKLCQETTFDSGLEVYKVTEYDVEQLYLQLYTIEEVKYVKLQREVYNTDPRFMLNFEEKFVPLNKILNEEEIVEEDVFVYQQSAEEIASIEQSIVAYDARPPFDESSSKANFFEIQEVHRNRLLHQLPPSLLENIADIRLLALGYCTEEVLQALKQLSKENEQKVNNTSEAFLKVQDAENIPHIYECLNFHDCYVTSIDFGNEQQFTLSFDSRGGFTSNNQLIFQNADIIKQEEHILNSYWLYAEAYRTEHGYEVHALFSGEDIAELIIHCTDVIVKQV
ncbi:DUF4085 family protein [Paenibacillus yanchengensis]|uniref:DUF4085 family protein n=1 Tax=Paenibacillus yanchengensis TaxID=2035833 RepID=A0ABW4YFB4_9BACL